MKLRNLITITKHPKSPYSLAPEGRVRTNGFKVLGDVRHEKAFSNFRSFFVTDYETVTVIVTV